MNHVVGRLSASQITTRLGMSGIHLKELGPCSTIQQTVFSIGYQSLYRPSLSFVEGEGSIKSISTEGFPILIGKEQATFTRWSTIGMVGKRYKKQRTFIQTGEHQALMTFQWREFRGRIGPCLTQITDILIGIRSRPSLSLMLFLRPKAIRRPSFSCTTPA